MANFEVEGSVIMSDISDDSSSYNECYVDEKFKGKLKVPPFVSKLYELVNNKAIDSTISWVNVGQMETQGSSGATSFAIWDVVDFVNNVLPMISKSNIFDSFISQLNNYGFKKVSWDRREYKNEWFQEGKPHLLKHIKSRNKKCKSDNDNGKVERAIKDLENESKKLDYEQQALKAYVDKMKSNQQKLLQAMAKAIKSTFDHHRARMDVTTRDIATMDLTLDDQEPNQTSLLCESSIGEDSHIVIEE